METLECSVCHNYIQIDIEYLKYSHKCVSNIFVCHECIKHYFETRKIHHYICATCGCEFEINKPMRRRRNLSMLIGNNCSSCQKKIGSLKKVETIRKRYDIWPSQRPEVKEKSKQTSLIRYGVENPAQSEKIKNKIKGTFEKRYGVTNASQIKDIQEKKKKNSLEKYGAMHPFQREDVKEKIKETCLNKYGVENPAASEEIKEKIKETFNNKYGGHPFRNESVLGKRKKQMLEKYGVEYPLQSENIYEKFKNTCIEHFGVVHPSKAQTVRLKYEETCLARYGVRSSSQSPTVRSKVAKNSRFSKLEKRIMEMLIHRNIDFVHQYVVKQNGVTHAFDFAIFQSEQLVALVDTDGLFFHAYLGDADGKLQNDSYDTKRTLCIPEGVKFIVIFEKHIEDGFRELLSVLNMDYDSYIEGVFSWCRTINFPWYEYSKYELEDSFRRLSNYEYFKKNGKVGERIIRHFHPSILRSRRAGCISPYDGYMDDELLMKVIKNRFIYVNKLEPARILEGFNISKIAPKVSVFSPSLAKTLVQKYLSSFSTVFDPFSGFSGRMLGTCSLGKKYIGQDINGDIVRESNHIIEFFCLEAEVSQKDILESSGEYPCLFTCSPYSNKEIWGTETEFRSCDEWIDECLARFRCSAYLFVVDETKKYNQFVVEELTNKSHFGKNVEKVVLIQNRDS